MKAGNTNIFGFVLLIVIALAMGADAAEWNLNGNGDWNDNGNWTNPGTYPNAADALADMTKMNLTANRTVNLNVGITIGTLSMGDSTGTSRYYISSNGVSGTLTFDVSSGSALIEQLSQTGENYIRAPITLADDMRITNASSSYSLVLENAPTDNGGNDITASGYYIYFRGAGSVVSGAGSVIASGASTRLNIRESPHTYTGSTIITNGAQLMEFNNLAPGPLCIAGGTLVNYWSTTFTRTLGNAAGQVEVLPGSSGFCGQGSAGFTVRFNNNSSYEVVWGSTYFRPDVLVLQSSWANQNGDVTIDNPIDLNGADRVITCNKAHTDDGGYSRLSRVIRTSSGTAGITKLGPGTLRLEGANTYNGNTRVAQGMLQLNSSAITGIGTRTIMASNGVTICAASSIDNTFLTRLDENTNVFTVALGANSANDLDFNSSTGANLSNARLGCNGSRTYSGTLTPNSGIYRLGGGPYNGTLTVSGPISGDNEVVSYANVTLSGTISYAGDTTVESGTLTVNSVNTENRSSTVTIAASGATLNLNFVGTNSVGSLFIGSTEQDAGVYGAGGTPLGQLAGTGAILVPPAGTVFLFR